RRRPVLVARGGEILNLRDSKADDGADDYLEGVAFSPDGSLLFSKCRRGQGSQLAVWDVARRRSVLSLPSVAGPVCSFSGEGNSLICGGHGLLATYEVGGRTVQTLLGHQSCAVQGMAISPSGDTWRASRGWRLARPSPKAR